MELKINKKGNKTEIYQEITLLIQEMLNQPYKSVLLSGSLAILKEYLPNINWVGIYLIKDNKLVIEIYQGEYAQPLIELNKGLTSQCFLTKKIILENDVSTNCQHIACSLLSKSEIVIPLLVEVTPSGVLDVDSSQVNNFDEIDKKYLAIITAYLTFGILKLN
ncbi:MAG: histidine kinase [Bacillales bacterium]|jgi:GAF domain-containing protein|nr:histidine kinase [Bacillales bacterium]